LEQANRQRDQAQAALTEIQAVRDLPPRTLDENEAVPTSANDQRQPAEEALRRSEVVPATVARTSNRVVTPARNLQLIRRTRPLRLGASIGSPQGIDGSLCCVVKDSKGKRYLLNLRPVFAGEVGAPILQPGLLDGGTLEKDQIATVFRIGQDRLKGGALAKLEPGVTVDFRIPEVGRLRGIERTVYPGDKVRLVGRSSGIVEGKVLQVNDKEVITSIVPLPGENGAPVLSDDGELVGLLWGGNQTQSLVVRIVPILRELNVKLVER
jgi:hypothetical protein